MQIPFEEKAARSQVWARAFLMGPTGSGKSRGAFELASRMFGGELPVTLINTERDREKLYADRYEYSLINLVAVGDYSPETFIAALDLAEERHPGGIIIIDSVSHEWMGDGGVLSMADRFGDWKVVRPRHDAFITRVQSCDAHVIAVARAKMQYEVSEEVKDGRRKQVIEALGVGPVQDKDFQYEFNLVGMFDQRTREATFSGHCDPLVNTVHDLLASGQDVADSYSRWLSEGEPIAAALSASEDAVAELVASLREEGISQEQIDAKFGSARRENRGKLHPDYVAEQHKKSLERVARKARKGAPDASSAPETPSGATTEASAPPNAEGGSEAPAGQQEALTPA